MNKHKSTKVDLKTENLPNARAGHPYRMQIGNYYSSSGSLSSSNCWFEGLDETGLRFFPDKRQIAGVPMNSGSFDMQLNIKEYNESGMEELSTHRLRLIVEDDYDFGHDEADETDPFWKPDEEVSAVPVNRKNRKRLTKDVVAASKRGRLHMEQGKIREDDFFIQYDDKTRWYALAVADGAGKSKYSRKGSEIVCRTSVEHCLSEFAVQSQKLKKLTIAYCRKKTDSLRNNIETQIRSIIASSVKSACEAIVAETAEMNSLPDDYATTLLLCICKKFEFGWLIGAFSAGDGAVCLYDADRKHARLMGGGARTAEKCFITAPGITRHAELDRRIQLAIVDDFSAIIMMTNGVSDAKFQGTDGLHSYEQWNRLWNDITATVNFPENIKEASEKLLKWLDFWVPGKNDDRTVAVLF